MTSELARAVTEKLTSVAMPDGRSDIVTQGLISPIVEDEGRISFSIAVNPDRADIFEPVRKAAQEAASSVEGVKTVLVALTAEVPQGSSQPAPQPAPQATSRKHQPAAPRGAHVQSLPGVTAIIAVASGKGGVGKSTTTANLALGLAANGLKVGVLDADIYGPSMPKLFGSGNKPELDGQLPLKPLLAHGVKVMSMGFFVDEEVPMVWRGPMVTSALTQLLHEVEWAPLDVLVVDMPPGTGDVQLTMAQQVPLAGVVIVSTPQDLALIDARKGVAMFQKVDVPILGLVENMSYFLCPSCGERSDIFGHGGARAEADRIHVPFLGEVPLHMDIRETSDSGTPIVASEPDGAHARIYRDIATKVMEAIDARASTATAGPRIVVE